MVKPMIKRVTSSRVRSKSPKIDDFMKNSMISPVFQYPGENYPISHQSHAPHTPHTSHVVEYMSDKSVPSEDSEGYTSSSGESYIDNETNEMIPVEETYANATRKKDLKIYRMKDLLDKLTGIGAPDMSDDSDDEDSEEDDTHDHDHDDEEDSDNRFCVLTIMDSTSA